MSRKETKVPIMRLSFADFLEALGDGRLVQKCEEKLVELQHAVMTTGKVGKLVIALNVKREGDSHCAVSADVKVTKPEQSVPGSIFFFSDYGLTRENPKQLTIRSQIEKTAAPGAADQGPGLRSLPDPPTRSPQNPDDDDDQE